MTDSEMQPIDKNKRRVVNIADAEFLPLIDDAGRHDGDVLQLNRDQPLGQGFHIYRMAPGHTTTPHTHKGVEEFLVLEGEIIDHDGYQYRKGDLVLLEAGTRHNSYSPDGALIAVYFR